MEEKRKKAVARAHRTRLMNLKWHKREGDPRTPDKVYYEFKNRLQEKLGQPLKSKLRTRLQYFLSHARTKFPQSVTKYYPKPPVLGSTKLEKFLELVETFVVERDKIPSMHQFMMMYNVAKKEKPKEIWI